MFLIGNKCDLEEYRVISTEEGQKLAEKLQMTYFEMSAKENIGVNEGYKYIIDETINANLDNSYKSIRRKYVGNKQKIILKKLKWEKKHKY